MIKLNIINDYSAIPTDYKSEDTVCYIATDNEGYIGHCIFGESNDNVVLYEIKTKDGSFSMIDGLARASIFSKSERCKHVIFKSKDDGVERFATAFKAKLDEPFLVEKVFESHC